jgi:hypothetical protein
MHEEGRHILFFVNWVAWQRRNIAWWKRPWFEARILGVWAFLIWERIGIAKGLDGAPAPDNNFTAQLLDICLAENDRRLSAYDARLVRPRFVPAIVRLTRRLMR